MKTILTYIKTLKKLELISPSALKGFDKLSNVKQEILNNCSAELSNSLGELKQNEN